ncbi:MAG: CDP-alcohol phosphatidyltransferase family protein [Candidatus Glassbacteria bacterium]
MLPESIKDWYINLTDPLTGFFTRHRVHPNVLTTIGFLLSCLAAFVISRGSIRMGGFLILLAGTFDVFDGGVARASGMSSQFGSFFDSSLDRYAEIVLSLGILIYFLNKSDMIIACAIVLALGGGLMVSYARARAEALGIECKVGFFQRPERILSIGLGALLGEGVLKIVLWILVLLSNFTAVQRMIHVYNMTRGESGGSGKRLS